MGSMSFFRRLVADPTANTIVISAAALIPLIGMVGGAVDASRFYMTTTRLQAACDAGALAARRAMDDNLFQPGIEGKIGDTFFDENYDEGLFGLENRQRNYTADSEGVVTGTASGRLPTSLMHIFGFDNFDVSVTCSADINIANTDIMFVLDVTGSMNCPADSAVTCANGNNFNTEFQSGGANASRIQALRDAVMNFYDVVEDTTSPSAQVRYGFVPYSHGVNVGTSIKPWLAANAEYQSRQWIETTTNVPGNGVEVGDWIPVDETFEYLPRDPSNLGGGIWISHYQWQNNQFNSNIANASARDKCLRYDGDYAVGSQLWRVSNPRYWLNVWNRFGASTRWRAACVGNIEKFRRATAADVQADQTITVSTWSYGLREFDVSNFQVGTGLGNPVVTDTGTSGSNVSHNWNGCIEETTTTDVATFDPLPTGANDLDIDFVPSNDDERWKPALPGAVHYRHSDPNGNGVIDLRQPGTWIGDERHETEDDLGSVAARGTDVCPVAARRLDANMTRGNVQAYVNSLDAEGATFHDFGMIWGGRFISPDGIFAADNATAPNGDAIARHIIFMTDGTQATEQWTYGLYGIEFWDRRVTTDGSQDQMRDRHAERFQAVCRAARNKNISVWVVAFGTTLDANLTNCATAGRAFEADNAEELADTFEEIAEKISALRLTS